MNPHSESTWNTLPIPERVKERAASRWERQEDCWISTYSTGSHGYAQVGWKEGRRTSTVLAHRASWEHVNGPVPAGHTLDHLCKQRQCVNPGHLRVLTNYENARRTFGRDWPLGLCANGHPPSHTRLYSNGVGRRRRRCGTCYAATQRRYNQKRQAA